MTTDADRRPRTITARLSAASIAYCALVLCPLPPSGEGESSTTENDDGCAASECVAPGTPIAEYVHPEGLPFCAFQGHRATPAVFRDDHILVAGTIACGAELVELDAMLEHVADIDVELPWKEVEGAILHEQDWILANRGCDYRIAEDNSLAAVCEDRNTGDVAIATNGAGHYIAVHAYAPPYHYELAYFGATSPALGDAPLWNYVGQHDANGIGIFQDARFGVDGSVFVSGFRDFAGTTTHSFLLHLDAAGNPLGYTEYPGLPPFRELAVHPDGDLIAVSAGARLVVLAPSPLGGFEIQSDVGLQDCWTVDVEFDPVGDLLYGCWDVPTQVYMLHKRASDGVTPRWSTEVDAFPQIAFAENGDVIVTGIRYPLAQLTVTRFTP